MLKMLGNGRVEAMCFDGEKRLAHIRGKMRKKVSTPSIAVFVVPRARDTSCTSEIDSSAKIVVRICV